MIKFQTSKYNDELNNAFKYLKNNFGHNTELAKLLNQYNIDENDTKIVLYKNNKKIEEYYKGYYAESATINKLLKMIASEFNNNHEGEDNFYLYDNNSTAFDDTHTLSVDYADNISGRFQYVNDNPNMSVLSDQIIALLTNDVDFDSWYHERLVRLNITEFNNIVKRESGLDFIKEIKNQYGFVPDNKFLSEFINEIDLTDLQTFLDDYYSVTEDINYYLNTNNLNDRIALYVTDDLTYHYMSLACVTDDIFKYIWDETSDQAQGFALVNPLTEEELQNLADYIQKINFERFDCNIAYVVEDLLNTNPEEVADTYECIQKRIYAK